MFAVSTVVPPPEKEIVPAMFTSPATFTFPLTPRPPATRRAPVRGEADSVSL